MLDYLSPVKEVELKAKGGIYVVSMSFSTANISRSRSKTKKRVEGGGGGETQVPKMQDSWGGYVGACSPRNFGNFQSLKWPFLAKKVTCI